MSTSGSGRICDFELAISGCEMGARGHKIVGRKGCDLRVREDVTGRGSAVG